MMPDKQEFFARAFDAIAKDSGMIIVGIDSDARINFWTDAAERCFGMTGEQILGEEYLTLLPENEHAKFRKNHRKVARGRSAPEIVMRHRRGDGEPLDTNFSLFAMAPGTETTALAVITDITERNRTERALKESSQQIQAIVQTVLDGVITIDAAGTIEAFNPAAERIFQYTAHEVIGRNVSTLMPEPDRSRHDSYITNYLETREAKIIGIGREVLGLRKDGTEFPMALAVNKMTIDDRIAFVGVVTDISERKAAENALRESQEKTMQANIELSATLEELRSAQEQLVQSEKMAALGQMVAGVAHEINTPVGVGITAASQIEGAAAEVQAILEDGRLKKSELKHFLESTLESSSIVLRNLERAAALITSFKLTSADQTNDERRRFELGEYTGEIIASLEPMIKHHHATVTLDCPKPLMVDSFAGAYAQVITNLVKNSLEHGFPERDGGTIDISIQQEGAAIHLRCCDNGRGVTSENLGRLFDPFFTTARSAGNTGLGLNICFNLVTQVLLGEITVESELGSGTCFDIRLPATV